MIDTVTLAKELMKDEEIKREVEKHIGKTTEEKFEEYYDSSINEFTKGAIIKGRVIALTDKSVILDIGYKSEGFVPLEEFEDASELEVGDDIEVLLEAVEDESGVVMLSKRKADRIRGWEKLVKSNKEGDLVTGRVIKKIKGGLLVDVGVPVFLPASQIDIRRLGDIAEYIGQEMTCKIIKIDTERKNIVVSRRRLIEEEREKKKKDLLEKLNVGDIIAGIVKNITDFGAFIDLGAMDGLLHITDMTWGRISHPSELLAINDKVEVKVLDFDREKERISLGLKQKTKNPWLDVEEKYPVDSKVKGQVVNVVPYGAFVKLETGVEGLVHISEMSWTKKVNHPSEVVAIGDTVEVVVLNIDVERQQISLGIKQLEDNPWEQLEEKYPVNTVLEGRVRNITNYGAFVELEEGIDGLLHVSDMSWTKKVNHPGAVLKKGDKVRVVVLAVDKDNKKIALGMKQLEEDPWETFIPFQYKPGKVLDGSVTKITNFGVFVELDKDVEGLLHISEISEEKIEKPDDVLSVGDDVRVKILNIDTQERKIGLSMRAVTEEEKAEAPAEDASAAAPAAETLAAETNPRTADESPAPVEADSAKETAPVETDSAETTPEEDAPEQTPEELDIQTDSTEADKQ